jgi:hypothetical protein
LFSSGGNCVTPKLQLCLVSSSPRKVGQFNFECCPLSWRSAPASTTCPDLGGWPVAPLRSQSLCFSRALLGACGSSGRLVCHPTLVLSHCCFTCTESLAPCPTSLLQSRFSIPSLPLLLVLDYGTVCFSVLLGMGFSLPRGAGLFFWRVGRGVTHGA